VNREGRSTLEKLRGHLYAIKRDIDSLKSEEQRAFVEGLESAAATIEDVIEKIRPALERDDAGAGIDMAKMTFGAWLKEEMRKGAYVSVADAAAAYEAAGYQWLKD
jgi:hypothetical protein